MNLHKLHKNLEEKFPNELQVLRLFYFQEFNVDERNEKNGTTDQDETNQ